MTRNTAPRKPLTKAQLFASIAATTGVPTKQVATILDALAAEIRQSLDTTGVITILGLVRIEKKTIFDCPTWPTSVKVTVVSELLPGPDERCDDGLHEYYKTPAMNDLGHPGRGNVTAAVPPK